MVSRTIEVYDSEFFTVAAGSPSLVPGSSIINNSDTPDGTIFEFSGAPVATVTLDDTSGNAGMLEDDDYANHTITDGAGLVMTGVGVEAESLIFVRALDASGNQTGPTITITVFSQNNVTQDVWAFHSDTALVAGTQYVKTSGSNFGSSAYTDIAVQPVCFAEGTLIDTPLGPRPAETLKAGDLVETLDHGPAPIRWIRRGFQLMETVEADAKPVLIAAGSLGPQTPAQDLIVSPQHRILVGGHQQLQAHFAAEVLAPAKSLTAIRGIRRMLGKRKITWVHFACDRHEVVTANGCLTESLLLGAMAVNGMREFERGKVTAIFGVPAGPGAALNGPPARQCLSVGAVRRILAESLDETGRLSAGEIRRCDADRAVQLCEAEPMRDAKGIGLAV